MKVLKVELEGLTASFRYPHFLVGRQPTYIMPPPATIYGHICSACGEFVDPGLIRFGYCFRFEGKGDDFEHIYQAKVAGRYDKKLGCVKNIEAELVPVLRELLLFPRMTLYIDAPAIIDMLSESFRRPRYAVVLGRSQDLAAYRTADVIELREDESGYFEDTLLPWSYRTHTALGTAVLMPRFINPEDRREVSWERYITLRHRVFYGAADEGEGANHMIRYEGDGPLWVDPETPSVKDMRRAIAWHTFVDRDHGAEGVE
ncbi:MAG TPA: type I-B CRISPR-associated protein Cas5 [Deltaproteobacteria bacterium]|nr:type I-B CRISPR-associated protein Cas5 [Deltaproteobacteria bacterium]